jgi:hypothetical protein
MVSRNGKWKIEELFDNDPQNIVDELIDIQPDFISEPIKPTLWDDGLVWVQPKDRSQYHFPAIQTIYGNDTSVANSFFTLPVLCTVTKIAHDAHRSFTGTISLTNPEFIQAVTDYLNNRLKGELFGGAYTVIPEVIITEEDELLGYSWRVNMKIYGNTAKTKMINYSEIFRSSDLNNA